MDEQIQTFLSGITKADSNPSPIKFLPPEIRCNIIRKYMIDKYSLSLLIRKGYTSLVREIAEKKPDPLLKYVPPKTYAIDAIESNNLKMVQTVLNAYFFNMFNLNKTEVICYAIKSWTFTEQEKKTHPPTNLEIIKYLIEFFDYRTEGKLSQVTNALVMNDRIDVMNYLETWEPNFLHSFLNDFCIGHIRSLNVLKWMEQRHVINEYMSNKAWHLFDKAIEYTQSLDFLEYIYAKYKTTIDEEFSGFVHSKRLVINNAIWKERVQTVKWLYSTFQNHFDLEYALDSAASYGVFELVKWVLEKDNAREISANHAFADACACGHYKIAIWLHANREDVRTSRIDSALNMAVLYDHWDIVEFLVNNRDEVCTTNSFEHIYQHMKPRSLDLLLKIYEKNPRLYVDTSIVDDCLLRGDINMLKFCYEKMNMINVHQLAVLEAHTMKKRRSALNWLKKRNARYQVIFLPHNQAT